MADSHGHDHDSHDSHGAHDAAEELDAVRTPGWLPFVGIGLLLVGSLFTYRWVYSPSESATPAAVDADGGVGDGGAPGNNPAPAAAH